MSKPAILPALILAAGLIAGPVFAQSQPETPSTGSQAPVVPNATPAGPDFDPEVRSDETPSTNTMETPEESTNGAPTGNGRSDENEAVDTDEAGDAEAEPAN